MTATATRTRRPAVSTKQYDDLYDLLTSFEKMDARTPLETLSDEEVVVNGRAHRSRRLRNTTGTGLEFYDGQHGTVRGGDYEIPDGDELLAVEEKGGLTAIYHIRPASRRGAGERFQAVSRLRGPAETLFTALGVRVA